MAHAERTHAKLSASSAHRWLKCTGSVALERHFSAPPSEFAVEGTLAHEVAELKLLIALDRISKKTYANRLDELGTISSAMHEYTHDYVKRVMGTFSDANGLSEINLEHKVDYSHIAPDGFGTCDVVIVSDRVLYIIDFKYGFNPVSAHHNPQLMLYALGVLATIGQGTIDSVRMVIDQPRIDNYSTFEISTDELQKWGIYYAKPIAQIAFDETGEIVPGKHCKYCKANSICREYATDIQSKIAANFQLLTPYELAELYKWLQDHNPKKFAERVTAYMTNLQYNGVVDFPGLKVIQGYGRGKVDNIERVINILVDDFNFDEDDLIKPKTLNSLTDIKRLVKTRVYDIAVAPHVNIPVGGPKLVRISAKGEPIRKVSATDDFENEDFNIGDED